ncbi:ras guanine nucleotide exchange factor a [Anaeramoeba flamelloides]|uniref:Ras guanine nucleotide exchange factor a n=1 Tax=Anaeramoeba flamelloides TaxID=1746091 RepID=A0ABQ8XF95_9EUKA|nr:ras guanine nucleotide exchange factor a [Anaeramoeba flamelloides]
MTSSEIQVGSKIKYLGCVGVVKYIGPTTISEKIWYGIEFEEKIGDSNGTIGEIAHFKGKEDYCKFLSKKELKLSSKKKSHPETATKKKKIPNNHQVTRHQSYDQTTFLSTSTSKPLRSVSKENLTLQTGTKHKHKQKQKKTKNKKMKESLKKLSSHPSFDSEFVPVNPPQKKTIKKIRSPRSPRQRSQSVRRKNSESKSKNSWKMYSPQGFDQNRHQTEKQRKQLEVEYEKKDLNTICSDLRKLNKKIERKTQNQQMLTLQISSYDQSIHELNSDSTEVSEENLRVLDQNEEQQLKEILLEIQQLKNEEKEIDLEEKKAQEELIQFRTQLSQISNDELANQVVRKKQDVMKSTHFYQELNETNENLEKETQIKSESISTIKESQQIEIDDLQKKIKLMNLEIKKAEEREKNFGKINLQSKRSIGQLEKKLSQLKDHMKILKKRIFDLEIGKDEHSTRMDAVLEFRDKVDRSDWKHRLIKKNPEIMDLRERINPLQRAISFSKYYSGSKVQLKEHLTKRVINQLIMQHLEFENKTKMRKMIEEVTLAPYNSVRLNDSRLLTLLRISLREIENLFDLLMDNVSKDPNEPNKEEIKNLLETKIDDLGLEMVADENVLNIWEEPEDNPKNIIYDTGEDPKKKIDKNARIFDIIHCANINKLVEKLTNNQTEVRFRDAFIMTYQSFMKPEYLLSKLKERYNVPPKKRDQTERDWVIKRDMIQVRVISALNSWIKSGWADIDDKLLFKLIDFIKTTILPDKKAAGEKLIKLINNMKASRETSGMLIFKDQPQAIVPKNLFSSSFTLLDVHKEEMARQITLMNSDMFRKIKPSELVTEAWQKKGLRSKATNVLKLINKFNEYGSYIATQIVHQESLKDRVKMYSRFLKIGKFLLEMNNYDYLMATVAGYTNSAVKRLKLTIAEVPKNVSKYLVEFKNLFTHAQGYKEYRDHLDKTEPPVVPYLGVFLTDITFISSGSPNKIDGLINFSKRKLLYNVVSKIQEYQRVPYKFQYVHQIQVLLRKPLKGQSEKELYQISLKREPRK